MSPARPNRKGRTPADRDPLEEAVAYDARAAKSARRFLQDIGRLLKRHGARVSKEDRGRLTSAMDGVEKALTATESASQLSSATSELESKANEILHFAKKSTLREYAESIVVAIVIAVVLRAFVVEAFKIPTGSMIPTLEVGDHIFVNKFIYGLRMPLTNLWFAEWGAPIYGDVIVFKYPRDTTKDYIKRVVAVTGDRVRVDGRDVFVNGEKLDRRNSEAFDYWDEGEEEADDLARMRRHADAFPEKSRGVHAHEYTVLYDAEQHLRGRFPNGMDLPGLACAGEGLQAECTVKPRYVFVMGDNRDNSSDSRVWGGVPLEYVKGKALFVWWSRGPMAGVRWARIGKPVP